MRTGIKRRSAALVVIFACVLTTGSLLRDTRAAENAEPASSSFVPYFFDDFEAYDDGVSLSKNKPFDAAGRSTATNEVARRGRRSARMAIHEGDKGGFGRWGGIVPYQAGLTARKPVVGATLRSLATGLRIQRHALDEVPASS